jgi:hypothetical protein
VGEQKLHTEDDPFEVSAAQLVSTIGRTSLTLFEGTFKEGDKDIRGRRVEIDLRSKQKRPKGDTVTDLSEAQLATKYEEFVDFANEAYQLEGVFPVNYCEHCQGQVNVHFMVPDGWTMHCYPKPGTRLASLSETQIEMARLGNKYIGQHSPSNPFVAEWIVSESIPGHGVWHESYTIRQKSGFGAEFSIDPQDLSDLSVEFVKL